MGSRKWSLLFVKIYIAILIIVGGMVVIIDPFFHYHAPMKGLSYSLGKEAYSNDGISKNFEYNAMITGTSMTKAFKIEEAEQLFGKKFVRTTFLGEGFKRINDNLESAIEANPELELVIRSVDAEWFISGEDWLGYEEYPEYLYDDSIWNDTNYIYNKEILVGDLIPEIVRTLRKEPADQFDNDGVGEEKDGGKEKVLKKYIRPEKEDRIVEESETKEYFYILENNLEKNIISVMKNNPDVTFYLFFPPYSICWWDSLNQRGVDTLKRRIALEEYTIEKILECDNAILFSFNNNYELTCNLNNYIDSIHYIDKVNSGILNWMKKGKYRLTKENYQTYIEEITQFYSNYDYESLF